MSVTANINSLIDKLIIINVDEKSVEDITQAVETALKTAKESIEQDNKIADLLINSLKK